MKLLISIIKVLPWLIVLILGVWIYLSKPTQNEEMIITHHTLVQEIEAIGKIELVRYNFKEITEVKKLSKEYLKIFKLGPDSKIALISIGEAAGCIDLTKIQDKDVSLAGDSIFIALPTSELCYYKLDMSKTRIYSLETNPMVDEKEFIQSAYKSAEDEIKRAALNSGILEQTNQNAESILRPILEKLSGKKVIFTFKPSPVSLDGTKQ
ncbi:MAG TPA: DUF4230 domain-containing protein [Fulvivirga sp.]|nr:DUF4230 domain-containing protein [Fulvivirga sp.]